MGGYATEDDQMVALDRCGYGNVSWSGQIATIHDAPGFQALLVGQFPATFSRHYQTFVFDSAAPSQMVTLDWQVVIDLPSKYLTDAFYWPQP